MFIALATVNAAVKASSFKRQLLGFTVGVYNSKRVAGLSENEPKKCLVCLVKIFVHTSVPSNRYRIFDSENDSVYEECDNSTDDDSFLMLLENSSHYRMK